MYQDINFNAFTDAFNAIRPDNFTYEGLRALFDYLTEIEEETGEEIELDVIALCCEFSEITEVEFRDNYEGEPLEHELMVCALDNGHYLVGEG